MNKEQTHIHVVADGEIDGWVDPGGAICLKVRNKDNDPVELGEREALALAKLLTELVKAQRIATARGSVFRAAESQITGLKEEPTVKQQIERLSPYQNAKVFGILMALSSVFIVLPMFLVLFASVPPQARPPALFLLLAPLMYFAMGYIMVAVGCAIYNFMFKYIGGFEFQARVDSARAEPDINRG